MSYAGKDPRSRRIAAESERTSTIGRKRAGAQLLEREIPISRRGAAPPLGSLPPEQELDWQHIGIFAAGALIGAALGAGAALLLAPQSGAATRDRLARRSRRLRERTSDAWDDLRDELRYAARRGKRKMARRWARGRRDRQLDRDFGDTSLNG